MVLTKKSCVTLAALGIAVTCLIMLSARGTDADKDNPYREVDLRIAIIGASENTYGYDILIDGRILIHQPHIPAVPGNEGFASQADARKVADFVVRQIRDGVFPPTVSLGDLATLSVLRPTGSE